MTRTPHALIAILAPAIFLAAGPPAARGTSMIYYGTEKLASDCAFVALGHVVSVESGYHDVVFGGDHHEIYTWTAISVDRSWGWSDPGELLVLEEIGGQVDKRVSVADGIPRFEVGEEVLVFVERRPDGHYKTFSMFLGAMRVERRPGGGALLLRSGTPDRTVVAEGGFGADLIVPREDGAFELDDFLAALEDRMTSRVRD